MGNGEGGGGEGKGGLMANGIRAMGTKGQLGGGRQECALKWDSLTKPRSDACHAVSLTAPHLLHCCPFFMAATAFVQLLQP